MSEPLLRTAPDLTVGVALTITGAVMGSGGLVWIVTFYLSQGSLPIAAIESWNLLVGGAILLTGGVLFVAGAISLAVARVRSRR